MAWTEQTKTKYLQLENLESQWRWIARRGRGTWVEIGRSVQGRPISCISFGDSKQPTVLFSALMHGIELIGGLALLAVARSLVASSEKRWPFRFVFLPVVNPDAVTSNLERLRAGRRASMRCNARGVDLNRNFSILNDRLPFHPFAGSKWRRSYHYIGPRPFSEPETEAVARAARSCRPTLSISFHSFGNLLLYPWAHTKDLNARDAEYRLLGESFVQALPGESYVLKKARGLYPTVGDMDDWLDAELGCLAFTVELSRLAWSVLSPKRFLNPLFWMNPEDPEETVSNILPGIGAMLNRFTLSGPPSKTSKGRGPLRIVRKPLGI